MESLDQAGQNMDTVVQGTGVLRRALLRVASVLPGARSQPRRLRHVETLPLGARRSVVLVECDGRFYLLADGFSAVTPTVAVTEFSEPRS